MLRLARRKNRPQGSVLRRSCWCRQCKSTCPRHVLWPFLNKFPVGAAPFAALTAQAAGALLKQCCGIQKVKQANMYRLHDLRRGHAKDLQSTGASLKEILEAGQWSSPRFLKYLDLDELEKDFVVEAHVADSDEDE